MMPTGWTEKKLGEVCSIAIGKTPSRGQKAFWDTELQTNNTWLSIADLNSAKNKIVDTSTECISDKALPLMTIVSKGTLLLSFKLTIGRLAFAGKDLYTNEAIAQLPIKDGVQIDKYYLYYYLSAFDYETLLKGDIKIKGKSLNKQKLNVLPVYYPSLPEQRRIVGKLDALFADIDAARQTAEKNLQNSKELFKSKLNLFVQDCTHFPSVRLIDIYKFIDYRGVTPNKISDGVPLITAKNVKKGYIDYKIQDFISEQDYKDRQSRGVSKKGDILFTTEAPLGNVALANLEKFSAGQRIITLQQYNDSEFCLSNEFYCYYMQSEIFQKDIHSLASGATAQGIKAAKLKLVSIPLVPYAIQQNIVKALDFLYEQTQQLEQIYAQQIADLDELKQSILKKAFKGEL